MVGGNIISAIFMWLITWYLVRINALEDLGILSLVQSLGLIFFVFCTFKLLNVQITDSKNNFSESDYYFARLISALFCFLLVFIYISLTNYGNVVKAACTVYSLYYSLMIIKEYFSARYQINKNYKNIFISDSLGGFLSFLSFLTVFNLTASMFKSLLGMVLVRFLCIVLDHYMAKVNFKEIYSDFNLYRSLRLIKDNFFLGISAVLVSSLILIPRFYIEGLHGLKDLGVFSALTSIMFFINIFLNSLTQVFLKDTIDIYNVSKVSCYKKIIINFLLISLFILIGLIPIYFFKDFLVVLIFNNDFLRYSNEFFYAITLSGFLFWFNYGNFILTVQRNFGIQIYISAVIFMAQMILCYFLVGPYNYIGAFVSMGITYILGFILCVLIFLWKEVRVA